MTEHAGVVAGKGVTKESIPPIPDEIAVLMTEVSQEGKLVE
ncbi:hypothetical protein GCM10029964_070560 [Kibdelosporangium lantanae]